GTVREATDAAVAEVFREEAGRLTAALVRALGDFDVAEECVQDALISALEHWPRDGIPRNPGAWLLVVAKRHGIDRLRRDARYREKLALVEGGDAPLRPHEAPRTPDMNVPDERLELVFTCCHPALSRLHRARQRARFRVDGALVLLREQDRSLWDREAIADAAALVEHAARMRRPGRYQLQAAIAATHASWGQTDWPEILSLYEVLRLIDPSPVVDLNRAIALRYAIGPAEALVAVDAL